MAKTIKEAVAEKIKVVDPPRGRKKSHRIASGLVASALLVLTSISFFVMRRFVKRNKG